MERICKRLLCILLCVCAFFSLAACKHVSRYSALMLVRSNVGGCLSVRFGSLNGRLNESFRKDADGEGVLSYTASLNEGALSVSYEGEDGKYHPLFSLKGGESISDEGGSVKGAKGKRVRILIETDGAAKNGTVEIRFKNGEKG